MSEYNILVQLGVEMQFNSIIRAIKANTSSRVDDCLCNTWCTNAANLHITSAFLLIIN